MSRGTSILITAGLVLAASLAAAQRLPAHGDEARNSGLVRVGLVGTLFRNTPEALIQIMVRPFKSLLESQTGMAGQVISGGNAENLGKLLKDDQVQLGVFHGLEFAWARLKTPGLKPLLIAVNEKPYLRANLVVRKDSSALAVADLFGKKIALPASSREHCRVWFERRCAKAGASPEKSYKEIATPADAEDALDAVFSGTVAAAVVDSVEMRDYARNKSGRFARLKTLLESEAFPCAVVAYVPGTLAEAQLERFRLGMIAARTNPKGQKLLDLCRITRFEIVPADYEQMLADIVKAYPPVVAKQDAKADTSIDEFDE
ncbi:MAG: phosphate/phosphite/phosphonate ABC transporter substrate-binding protein [Candidatus Acidiferrum sp.]